MNRQELLNKWSELQKPRPWMHNAVSLPDRISEELNVLGLLQADGCSQIPGEPFDVHFLIQDRKRRLREMHGTIHSP
jgi:hypothetical protein